MNNKLLKDLAKTVNLSPTALDIYFILMKHGEVSLTKLANMSDKSSTKVQSAILELNKKHLVRSKDENKKIFLARTILEIQHKIEQDQQMVQDLKNFVLPRMLFNEGRKFFEFEGWDEVRQTYLELLEEAKRSKSEFLAIENNLMNNQLGDEFIEKYIRLRNEYKIKAYVICPDDREDQKYQKMYQNKYTEVKLIGNLAVDGNVNIVGDTIMWFSPNTLKGDFEKNIAKANTQRSCFWKLWNQG